MSIGSGRAEPPVDDWDDDLDLDLDGPDPAGEFIDLWSAESPEALWQVLSFRHSLTGAQTFEAVALFGKHHQNPEAGAVTTALLLCTASRWGRETERLVAGLIDTAVLVDEDLDQLTSTFLWSDRYRFEYPAKWVSSEWIAIDLEGPDGPISIPIGRIDPDSPVVSERYIAPPLRRWAAARLLRADPRALDRLRARAGELGPIDGGAIASGVLDAVDTLDANGVRAAIAFGLGWSRGSVRLLALDILGSTDPDGASRRAAADPDSKVRAWSPSRLGGTSGPGRERGRPGPHDTLGVQTELFPE